MNAKAFFLTDEIPADSPLAFKPELVSNEFLIHRGIFSNDFKAYYFTVSDKQFSQFDIKVIRKENGKWSDPQNAFFNSIYNDHGMSFSPDGNVLVFSSTRPVDKALVSDTWHIWQSVKINGQWTDPQYLDIPNLRNQLCSHPTLSNDGTLYFHSSNMDYSEMNIFYAQKVAGQYQAAEKIKWANQGIASSCTPYISADGVYLLFASIGESLELNFCFKTTKDNWSNPIKLPRIINQKGQGNPYLTPDNEFLFYATESEKDASTWEIKWVSIQDFLQNKN